MRFLELTGALGALLCLNASACDDPGLDTFELDASVVDGQVVFSWGAGSMSQLLVYRCDDKCACNADGTSNIVGAGEFVWTAGGGTDDRSPAPVNAPIPYGEPIEGDVAALPLQPGARYIVTAHLVDWQSDPHRNAILAMGCDTFVAP